MDLLEAIEKRHSVRQYTDKKIEGEIKSELESLIAECNKESGLNMQLCLNDTEAFSTGIFTKLVNFKGANNYIAVIGKKSEDLDEKAGYFGENIVLKATQLGLNSCWVAQTFNKGKVKSLLKKDEKLVIVITIGYGVNDGVPHKNKPLEKLTSVKGEMPKWFENGLKAAQLAPTATNQQKFKFNLTDDSLVDVTTSFGFYNKVDIGIVKYHFEIGADSTEWSWK